MPQVSAVFMLTCRSGESYGAALLLGLVGFSSGYHQGATQKNTLVGVTQPSSLTPTPHRKPCTKQIYFFFLVAPRPFFTFFLTPFLRAGCLRPDAVKQGCLYPPAGLHLGVGPLLLQQLIMDAVVNAKVVKLHTSFDH